jgi:hypothetical protein
MPQASFRSLLIQSRLISMLFVVGICILAGIWKTHVPSKFTSSGFSLKLKQHLLVPAAFNNRHLSPLPFHLGIFLEDIGVSLVDH